MRFLHAGGVTPESLKGSLNLISPVKAVPLVAGGVTSAEGAWQGGYGQAHVLLPLLLLVCLVAAGVGQTVRAFAKQRSSSHKTKVIEEDAGTVVSVVPPAAAAAIADENGGGGTAPEFAVALSQGLIINSHDNYEIQGQVELSVLQEELHAMFASDETLTTKFGAETVKSILAEVGDRASEDAMHFGGGGGAGKTVREEGA
jgi:Na+-transporting methylmalonyl-CoA/oxaloacetate decarboxylase gamma subunit